MLYEKNWRSFSINDFKDDLLDNFVEKIQMMGTEDATTCHMAILRHTGKSHVILRYTSKSHGYPQTYR